MRRSYVTMNYALIFCLFVGLGGVSSEDAITIQTMTEETKTLTFHTITIPASHSFERSPLPQSEGIRFLRDRDAKDPPKIYFNDGDIEHIIDEMHWTPRQNNGHGGYKQQKTADCEDCDMMVTYYSFDPEDQDLQQAMERNRHVETRLPVHFKASPPQRSPFPSEENVPVRVLVDGKELNAEEINEMVDPNVIGDLIKSLMKVQKVPASSVPRPQTRPRVPNEGRKPGTAASALRRPQTSADILENTKHNFRAPPYAFNTAPTPSKPKVKAAKSPNGPVAPKGNALRVNGNVVELDNLPLDVKEFINWLQQEHQGNDLLKSNLIEI